MKVAFVNYLTSSVMHIGVEKKLIEQASVMKTLGVDVYVLNREKEGYFNNIHYINISDRVRIPFCKELYIKSFKMKIMADNINIDSYDFIILRYPLVDFSSLAYSARYGKKTVLEIHGNILGEIRAYRINTFYKTAQYVIERFLAWIFFRNIFMIIGVSDDVLREEILRTGYRGKTYRHSNGINLSKLSSRPIPELTDSFNMLFMATSFAEWHGLDRMLNSALNYSGSLKLKIFVVGDINSKYSSIISKLADHKHVEIVTTGVISAKEYLDGIYAQCHMAFNSIAMFRIGMKDSSTLKSKEYIINHLPFVYSAADPDLESVNKYLFRVSNDESLFDFEEIIGFYKNMDIGKMITDFDKLTENELVWQKKIKKLLDAIELKIKIDN